MNVSLQSPRALASSLASVSLAFGVAATPFYFWGGIGGMVLGVLGLVAGLVSYREVGRSGSEGMRAARELALAGIVLCALLTLLAAALITTILLMRPVVVDIVLHIVHTLPTPVQ